MVRAQVCVCACDFAMSRSRVFENHEFEAVAAKATKNAKEDVMKRFYIPIVGTLRCKYMGTQKSDDKELILFYTKVCFKWELSSPHVKGSVDLVFRCCFVSFVVLCVECCSPCLFCDPWAHCGQQRDIEQAQNVSICVGAEHETSTQTSKRTKKQTNNRKQRHLHTNKVFVAHLALREVAASPVVPFRMKRPLVISFFYSKIATDRLLPVMASSAYDEAKIGIHAIAMSKPLTKPPKKIVLKRRHTTAVETPVCARISDTHVLAAVPRDGPSARIKFTFAKAGLLCVADEKDKKRKSQKTSTSIITAVGGA